MKKIYLSNRFNALKSIFSIPTEVYFAIIGIMNEIQRKFLVSPDIKRWIKEQSVVLEQTEQFYMHSGRDTWHYYIKHFPDTYAEVLIDSEGQEKKTPTTEEQYKLARKQHIGRIVAKKSYIIDIGQETFVVAKYLKALKGLYTLVVHTQRGSSLEESEALQSLQPLMLKEIDKDQKYSTQSLSLCVEVMEYSVNKLFDQIDAFEAPNLFFWQVPKRLYVRDGVALVLYRNIRLLHHYKMNYQQKRFSASLHRLRVLLRRSATLLETFSDFFDPNVQSVCINLLLRYHEQTKLLRYLYFLEELCETKEGVHPNLHKEIKDLIFKEHRNVSQMLHSQPFKQLVQILTREVQDQEHPQCASLEDEVVKLVKQHLSDLETLLENTRGGHNEDMLEEIYASIDSLQTLVEDFFHILGEKKTQIIVDELNILLKPLREYRNCKEREHILNAIKEQSDETKKLDIRPLLCKHELELEEKITHGLKLLRASRFYV